MLNKQRILLILFVIELIVITSAAAVSWNVFHLMSIMVVLGSTLLLPAVVGSLNLYTKQMEPKIRGVLIVISLLGSGMFVWGIFKNNYTLLLISLGFLLVAALISIIFAILIGYPSDTFSG